MIVLDTNIVSEFMRVQPNSTVVKWLRAQPSEEIWTTSITVFEIQSGLNILPYGKRKHGLIDQFELALKNDFDGRSLSFDTKAAIITAEILANYKKAGQGADVRDLQIAGIDSAKGWTLVTRNVRDFGMANIPLVNPWQASFE